jgi:threonyl-tRNA synthetase
MTNMSGNKSHLQLGRERDLFSFHEEAGSGLPVFHPDGTVLRNIIIDYLRDVNQKLGFEEVWTPHLFNADLWKKSGHYSSYKTRMFLFKIGEHEYGLKPMNCPAHALIFSSKPRSYKDLPIMYSEFATVYRNEQEGELTGLLRVRSITQDDGHVFLANDQVESVLRNILLAAITVLETFGLKDLSVNISTKPADAIGDPKMWEIATKTLIEVASKAGLNYQIAEGEGAFYGPKIDVHAKDSLGRQWQLSTIQLDFNLGERLGLKYTDRDGKEKPPLIIHRALVGSLERFIGILLEHYKGNLPLWLAPKQVRVIPVSEKYSEYAKIIYQEIRKSGFRADLDNNSLTLPKRIRNAVLSGIPYMIVVGSEEETTNTVAVRDRKGRNVKGIMLSDLLSQLKKEDQEKLIEVQTVKILGGNIKNKSKAGMPEPGQREQTQDQNNE